MTEDPRARRRRVAMCGAVLVALTVAVFARSLDHGFVLLDDYSKVIENPVVVGYGSADAEKRLQTPGQGYVIPVTVATWAALWATGDGQARYFHAFALLVHVGVVLLLFGFLSRWSLPWALLAAAVVAVHPVVVEPVAWVTGLKDLLAAGFAVGATWLFVAGVGRGEAGRARVALAVLCAVLAALSKPTTVLLPGAWVLWLLAKRSRGITVDRRAWWMAGAGLAFGLGLGLLSWAGHSTLVQEPLDPTYLGDGRALYALGLQAWHLIAPVGLHPLYYVAPGPAWGAARTWLGVGVLLGLGVAGWRARRSPDVVLGLAWMVAAYLPVANVVPTPRLLADSYLYLPLCGALLTLVVVLSAGRVRFEPASGRGAVPLVAGIFMVVGLATLSAGQVGRWAGGDALWRPLIERWPHWDRGYYALASVRLRDKRDADAAALFAQAYERAYRPEHLADYGVALAVLGRTDDAECVLIEAIRHGNRPRESLRNFGRVLAADPHRRPRYPRVAARLLPVAIRAVAERRAPGAGALAAALDRLRRRLGPDQGPVPWPRGHCPLVRPRP